MAKIDNTYYLWRRSDGQVSVSTQTTRTNSSGVPTTNGGPPPKSYLSWTFQVLLKTDDFNQVLRYKYFVHWYTRNNPGGWDVG